MHNTGKICFTISLGSLMLKAETFYLSLFCFIAIGYRKLFERVSYSFIEYSIKV